MRLFAFITVSLLLSSVVYIFVGEQDIALILGVCSTAFAILTLADVVSEK